MEGANWLSGELDMYLLSSQVSRGDMYLTVLSVISTEQTDMIFPGKSPPKKSPKQIRGGGAYVYFQIEHRAVFSLEKTPGDIN